MNNLSKFCNLDCEHCIGNIVLETLRNTMTVQDVFGMIARLEKEIAEDDRHKKM